MFEMIEEMTKNRTCTCRICGNRIGHGEAFFADARNVSHVDCLLGLHDEED
jgi:hypothetical protein